MSAGLDTSVVVRLLVNEPAAEARLAREIISTASDQAPLLVSDLVIAESYFALRQHYGIGEPDARAALLQLVSDRRVRATPEAAQALERSSRETGLADRLIHAEYHRAGVETVTFDRRMARLPNVRLLQR